jgi:hypothetical protein
MLLNRRRAERRQHLVTDEMQVRARVQDAFFGLASFDAAQDFAMLALQQPQRTWSAYGPRYLPPAYGVKLAANSLDHVREQRVAGPVRDAAVQTQLLVLPLERIDRSQHRLVQLWEQCPDRAQIAVGGESSALHGVALEDGPQLEAMEQVSGQRRGG